MIFFFSEIISGHGDYRNFSDVISEIPIAKYLQEKVDLFSLSAIHCTVSCCGVVSVGGNLVSPNLSVLP